MNARPTLREHVSEYRAYARQMGRAEGTLRWLDTGLNRFVRFCEEQGIFHTDEVTKRAIRAYWQYLQDNLKGVATAASCVRAFFNWLEREEELVSNPVKSAGFPKDKRQTIQPLSVKEIEAVIKAAREGRNGKRDVALMLFLFDTGLRISEALSVTVDSLDVANSHVTVFGKMSKTRTVVYSYRTARAIKDYLRRGRPDVDCPYLFVTDDGLPLTRRSARLMLRRHGKKAGIEASRVSPHKWRHSFAVGFLRNGGSALHLQALLGHSTLDMTKRYVTFSGKDVEEAHQKYSPVNGMKRDDW